MLNLDELEAVFRTSREEFHSLEPYYDWVEKAKVAWLPLIAECRELRRENERYRKALEHYAAPNWDSHHGFPDIAREALG